MFIHLFKHPLTKGVWITERKWTLLVLFTYGNIVVQVQEVTTTSLFTLRVKEVIVLII